MASFYEDHSRRIPCVPSFSSLSPASGEIIPEKLQPSQIRFYNPVSGAPDRFLVQINTILHHLLSNGRFGTHFPSLEASSQPGGRKSPCAAQDSPFQPSCPLLLFAPLPAFASDKMKGLLEGSSLAFLPRGTFALTAPESPTQRDLSKSVAFLVVFTFQWSFWNPLLLIMSFTVLESAS